MEWQQLEYFQTVARLQHMTLAAKALAITQPALSRSISRLESELGVPLFERSGRNIILNRFGQLFQKRVVRILKEYKEARLELENLLSPEHGEVALGFLHTLGVHQIPDFIRSFRKIYPSIQFQLHENSSQKLLEMLLKGEIDLFMGSLLEANQQIQWTPLWKEELFLMVPNGHRLAGVKKINLEDIRNEPLISYKKGFGLRTIVDDLLVEANIHPPIPFEGEDSHTIAGLVTAGLGITFLPNTKGLDLSGITLLSIQHPKCHRIIGIATMKERMLAPPTEKFHKFVIDFFDDVSIDKE
ncbi:LysR family transcriptional regulator [Bacillaceae bacterium Marseille-Q3522]|nr:LysR family transcriptional regulator [Bacillaceae bacterium Marseille-Q3522]